MVAPGMAELRENDGAVISMVPKSVLCDMNVQWAWLSYGCRIMLPCLFDSQNLYIQQNKSQVACLREWDSGYRQAEKYFDCDNTGFK